MNRNLKDIFVIIILFKGRLQEGRVKKSKIAHYIFVTKATDIKKYIFKKPLKNGCRNMCYILIFV